MKDVHSEVSLLTKEMELVLWLLLRPLQLLRYWSHRALARRHAPVGSDVIHEASLSVLALIGGMSTAEICLDTTAPVS